MPNLTTGFPKRTGNLEDDYENLYNWSVSLIDELKSILCNLDSGNVTEANSVKAQNIDCTQARIKDAQMQSLTADKLTAGEIDAREIIVHHINASEIDTGKLNSGVVNIGCDDDYGRVLLDGDSLVFYEKVDGKLYQRIAIGRGDDGNYIFTVQNRDETQGVYMDSDGTIRITGNFIGGNIDIETDAKVGRKIILRDKNESTLGYENAAIISVDTGVVRVQANNSRTIELNTNGNIDLKCNSCKINGHEVLTE